MNISRKKTLSAVIKGFLLIPVLVVVWIFYLWVTYINSVVTEGESYGFSIGSSKYEIYINAPRILADQAKTPLMFFTSIEVTEDQAESLGEAAGTRLLVQTRFHPEGFDLYRDKDSWTFYLEGNFNNSISFEFCDELLCEIRRQRRYFDLP